MTRDDRIRKVTEAHRALAGLLKAAKAAEGTPDDLAAWAAVEVQGATIHRQSRLLAGKTKGG